MPVSLGIETKRYKTKKAFKRLTRNQLFYHNKKSAYDPRWPIRRELILVSVTLSD